MAIAALVASKPLRVGPAGLELVRAFESCMRAVPGKPGFFKPYIDAVGVLTIGWGHTNHHLPRFDAESVWSQTECDSALAGDMATFEVHVQELAKVKLEQCEFDALVSWSFNTGGPATASLWKKLNAGNKAAIPAELAKWNRGGGKVLSGLTRRRKAEGLMFAGDVRGALAVARGNGVQKIPPSVVQNQTETSSSKPVVPVTRPATQASAGVVVATGAAAAATSRWEIALLVAGCAAITAFGIFLIWRWRHRAAQEASVSPAMKEGSNGLG